VLFTCAGHAVLLDTPQDLRLACLRSGIRRVDAVLMSHEHADHVFGFDDLRAFSNRMEEPLPVYASPALCAALRRFFPYLGQTPFPGTTLARLKLHETAAAREIFPGVVATPLPVEHGRSEMTGWRVDCGGVAAAVVSDCKRIPPETMEKIRGVDLLVLDGLREEPHPTHFSFSEALDAAEEAQPKRLLLTHLCHATGHRDACALLARRPLPFPASVAFDRLAVTLPEN
jgi:phosphoribosyl 1,2-cyclic phosphate phosphodiesterase